MNVDYLNDGYVDDHYCVYNVCTCANKITYVYRFIWYKYGRRLWHFTCQLLFRRVNWQSWVDDIAILVMKDPAVGWSHNLWVVQQCLRFMVWSFFDADLSVPKASYVIDCHYWWIDGSQSTYCYIKSQRFNDDGRMLTPVILDAESLSGPFK